ncbi:MAG: DUF4339 domain-containing protein [Prosthecobacter sp.]|jgi:hypothetical protein|uniref:DUF4339 domain-containing protein n=1 Tax=Prosthecobacter sp. TaxID=1965333 RepID=UPI0019F5F4C7|nr:DUF4339 domain-containing protein [Prosthecobacter sp.]MBE2284900.1 DUF4339 domain-containing protein [Prosthecobacter sp.]
MNWYINNAGAAEGPKDAAAMAELVREKKLAPDSLVWHTGLEAWQTIAELSPAWMGGKVAPVVEKKEVVEKKDSAVRRLAGPKAPTAEAAEKKEGGGLLRRLFGFGKKK